MAGRARWVRRALSLTAGLIIATASGARVMAESGPASALKQARAVADVASARAADMDARVEAAALEAPASKPAGGSRLATATTKTTEHTRSRATERYNPAEHRDPFEPPALALEDGEEPRTPLERYEIGQLRLVGVVWGGPSNRAMVEDSAGLGYIVTLGTPIGSRGGFVRDIGPTRVLIEETYTNFYGEDEPREIVMELPQEDESP